MILFIFSFIFLSFWPLSSRIKQKLMRKKENIKKRVFLVSSDRNEKKKVEWKEKEKRRKENGYEHGKYHIFTQHMPLGEINEQII
jgi:hypothetical protein